MTANTLYSLLLTPTHSLTVFALSIVGATLFKDRDDAWRLVFVLFSGMTMANILKSLFWVPLSPSLGNAFAFPSGHTFAAMAMYTALLAPGGFRWWKVILWCLPIVTARVAMPYFGYHTPIEVYAGAGSALLWSGLCLVLFNGLSNPEYQWKAALLITLFCVFMHLNSAFYRADNYLFLIGCFATTFCWYIDTYHPYEGPRNRFWTLVAGLFFAINLHWWGGCVSGMARYIGIGMGLPILAVALPRRYT